jgi:hypothetical protein
MTRPSHLLSVLSLLSVTTALTCATPAQAAFEFIKKATPKTAPAAAPVAPKPAPTTVPVTNLTPPAPEPVAPVPVWTAKQPAPQAIPLTPVVSNSDSLMVFDAPLLPDMDQEPVSLAPARQTLAQQSSNNVTTTTAPAPVHDSAHDSVLWDDGKKPASVTSMTTERPDSVSARIPMRPPEPIVETILETPQAPVAVAPSDDAVVEGFGSGLPMVMALRQIVPPHYRFSFGPGVDPGQRVNWQGGKVWSQIVSDVSSSKGLQSEIAGNVVAIRRAGTSSAIGNGASSNMMEDVVLGATTFDTPEIKRPVAPPAPAPVVPKRTILSSTTTDTSKPLPIVSTHKAPQEKPPVSLLALPDEKQLDKPVERVPVAERSIDVAPAASLPTPNEPHILPPIIEEDTIIASAPVPLMNNTMTQPESVKAPAVGADLNAKQEWLALSGKTLRSVLQEWSQQAGVSLVWSSDFDYPLQTDIRINGSYPEAVRTLLAGFSKAQPKPTGRLHKNANVGAQPVLIIDTPRLINNG